MKQQGIALLTVLLIISIVTVIAAEMAFKHKISIAKTSNRINNLALFEYLYGAEQLVASILQRDGKSTEKTDSHSDIWAQSSNLAFPLPNGEFLGAIVEQNGKININDLIANNKINNQTYARLKSVFEKLEIDPTIINALIDWIDADLNTSFPNGAEDDYYLSLDSPYRVANQIFTNINEITLVRGFDDEMLFNLQEYITALPISSSLNINTANALILQALAPHITESMAQQFIEEIEENPFQTVINFKNHANNKGKIFNSDNLSVKSQYFSAKIQVKIGSSTVRTSTLFSRDESNTVLLLNRSFVD